jgi:hypothetical protein
MAKRNSTARSRVLSKGKTSGKLNRGKIKSRSKEVDGIKFKSMLEVFCYKKLKEAKLEFEYEEHVWNLMEGFNYPAMSFENRSNGAFEDRSKDKVRAITYTPDFVCMKDGKPVWVIECKGFANDRFPNTWKNFKRKLIEDGTPCPLFVPKNQKQILEVIKLITEL